MDSSGVRWATLPAARQAAAERRYGALVRLARTAADLTLAEVGRRVGYSASALSRIERGHQPLTDITVLRRFAAALDIPPAMFGLTDTPRGDAPNHTAGRARVPERPVTQAGDDSVRRRELLGGLAGLSISPLTVTRLSVEPLASPAHTLVARLEDLLLHPPGSDHVAPVEATTLRDDLRAVKADFQASRYRALTGRLPQLLRRVSALGDAADPATVAEAYNTTVQVLIKLGSGSVDWVAADRALTAARRSGDPAVIASVTRNVASLCRRARRYDLAQQLCLDAAGQLGVDGTTATAEHLSLHGILLCNAGYAAAQAGDRARSRELLDDAHRIAAWLGGDYNARWTAFGPTNVILHQVSAAYALGDAGTAIEHARRVPLAAITVPERHARLWVDVARAWHQWGKPTECYRALLAAERAAPEEVHGRPAVRSLAADLLTLPRRAGMDGLHAFATRLGAAMA